jgi:elongation factor 1-alpha
MIVVLNKMDDKSVKYSENRYKEVKSEVAAYLKKVGVSTNNFSFIYQ